MLWVQETHLFRILPNAYEHGGFYNLIETQKTRFPFLLEKLEKKKGKSLAYFDYKNVIFPYSRHHYAVNGSY